MRAPGPAAVTAASTSTAVSSSTSSSASNWEALRAKLAGSHPHKGPGSKKQSSKRPRPPPAPTQAVPLFGIPSFSFPTSGAAASAPASSSSSASFASVVAPHAGAVSFGALASLAIAQQQQPASSSRGLPAGNSTAPTPSSSATPSAAAASASAAALKAALGPFEAAVLSPTERQYVALDCEMVGVGAGGERSALAQVVVVDWAGRVLYMRYVRVPEPVTDYRTHVSGIRPEHLTPANAVDFASVQREVASLLKGRILVGHGLDNDLKCLMLGHPARATRDTAKYRPFCWMNKQGRWRPRKLKHLAGQHLHVAIQEGEHEPAEDARAALALYRSVRVEWEAHVSGKPLPPALAAQKEQQKAERKAKRQHRSASKGPPPAPGPLGTGSSHGDGSGGGGTGGEQSGSHGEAGDNQRKRQRR